MIEGTTYGLDVLRFWDWMVDRLEELESTKSPTDETDYVALLPRALEWQRWLLVHAMEILPGSDALRFRTVLLLVARQNGKSTILTALILWRMFQDGAKMTLETHASLDHAKKAWEEARNVAQAIPELDAEIAKANAGKGSELLALDSGEQFKIATANRRGGRGFSGDFVIFDELREHQDWASWSATSKTTLARRRAQIWGVSNAGDLSSVVLVQLRKIALAHITGEPVEGVPDEIVKLVGDTLGMFEWSASSKNGLEGGPLRDIWDRQGWFEANPSLNLTELDERAIIASLSDPEWEFRTEVLCQFLSSADFGPFPAGSWDATLEHVDDRSMRGVTRDLAREMTYCVDVAVGSRSMAYIAVAWWDTEGRIRFELAAQRAGTDWILPWLTSPDRVVPARHVTFQWRGAPVSSLKKQAELAGLTVTPWEASDVPGWYQQFYDRLAASVDEENPFVYMTHGSQPPIDLAARSAQTKKAGDGLMIDRHASPKDAAPLVACIGAVGLLLTEPEPVYESVYENRGLMVV